MLLVHGAFADASLWSAVVAQLREAGVAVRAAENPLRRLDVDAAHVADAMRGIVGPVLLAGHGYGGAVITSAATHGPHHASPRCDGSLSASARAAGCSTREHQLRPASARA
ncbi:alpha/beta fold hydrolase [Dactylosporangium sp. NPDC000521]|uniref:alpha/beta fold hydrolase n=1 Tax=Dactylosporangium sp. NPDC000521 TaxID=3363975 RepID=UPI00369BA91D